MSLAYKAVGWNRQKKIYDGVMLGGLVAYLVAFVAANLILHPDVTIETIIIRGFGTAALFLLHVILAIGPLCRLDRRFLPLLFNRRHLGVAMFVTALVHGVFSIIQFHVLGDENPLVSLFTANTRIDSLAQFPFQPLGFFALVILFLMAATSHDFWLANLTAPVWKALHMGVYVAYALILLHVAFGVLQAETHPILVALLGVGFVVIVGLHLAAALRENDVDLKTTDDYVDACTVDEIPEKRARIVPIGGERVAIFRYDGKISAVSNVCRHQNGPLGEGRIVDSCIVCPWHGYEYKPESGASPPPFTETVPTFNVQVRDGRVFVDPKPNPPGTEVEPASVDGVGAEDDSPFYVGYHPQAPAELAAFTRKIVAALMVLAVGLPVALTAGQRGFTSGFFEFGTTKNFQGTLREAPYPLLDAEDGPHHLVAFGKFGADDAVEGLQGKEVEVVGTLIYQDDQRMIELSEPVREIGPGDAPPARRSLGRMSLQGEIVDSKCYLGVMKPARGKPHRACAVRCISGGVPPIFLVTDRNGDQRYLLLTDAEGHSLSKEILHLVAEPLEIEGDVEVVGEVWYLAADPASFRRL